MTEAPRWAIIVHGGAHTVPPDKAEASRAGVRAAVEAGCRVLEGGGAATDAVEAAIRVMEDDPTFNAGYGSDVDEEGHVRMDAAMMDGRFLEVGAVAGLRGVWHPISVARRMLPEKEVLLIGGGARRFADEHGAELCDPAALLSPEQAAARSDTVGCVALDGHGHVAAGVSTGGLSGQRVGRVGDSPQVGCGFYADDGVGGVVLSGEGESIARMMVAARFIHRVPGRHPEDVLRDVLTEQRGRVGGEAGAVALTPDGTPGWWHTSAHLPVAFLAAGQTEAQVYLSKDEQHQEAGHVQAPA
ncbi:beta-aspartyl-peptidase (threonine type) [Deinococcus metalli]|uniref:Asparaginase n=1 Tax=Deinococcus metalli TaxID=1141878 RepID=A0A7W8NQ22_9DEIO|nr:isoaspartyl peptidase/L-asparaginase family protein [Deinococcus metalli]MBB5376385.1 beta-aspartyl-peptidase (threonine type) [Deinococcus metalli]GHF44447.1 asparaginase [Deinococcus metalli]